MTTIGFSNILTALSSEAIGSKVKEADALKFLDGLEAAVDAHDTDEDRVPGQHFIVMGGAFDFMKEYVSAGDGPASDDPEDYVVRKHREGPALFLKRHLAGEVQFLACVVYTLEAYGKDPEVDVAEVERLQSQRVTHVLVAVIASSGPAAPLTPFRFVSNLAGGNREALEWSADEIRSKAAEIKDYWTKWSVVAD